MEKQEESQGKILVVDDEVKVQIVLRRFLSTKGYTVSTAGNGKEALSMLQEGEVDVALMDIYMPEMDGFELLKAVRAMYPDTTVIMLTAVADLEIAVWALKTGAVDYITKPFNFSTILICLQRALRMKRLEEENRSYREELENRVRERTQELEEANAQLKEANARLEETNARLEEAYQELLHAVR